MDQFFSEYWWSISLAVVVLAFAAYRFRSRPKPAEPGVEARSFAAIRAFRPEQLQPCFGTYSPRTRDKVGFLLQFAWFVVAAIVLAYSFEIPPTVSIFIVLSAILLAWGAVYTESKSRRVLGPDHIAFESPIRLLSWSVPLSQISQCDLVPGRPFNRLRVYSHTGNYTLPLTAELWSVLSGLSN